MRNDIKLPKNLLKLIKFDKMVRNLPSDFGYYAAGFELSLEQDDSALMTYSDDINFINSFYEIGMSDGSGGGYYFWLYDESVSLSNAPIVFFGSEGEVGIATENFDDLLKMLSLDSHVSFYEDDDNEAMSTIYIPFDSYDRKSEFHDLYVNWLKDECNLNPIEDRELFIIKAQERYQNKYYNFLKKYIII